MIENLQKKSERPPGVLELRDASNLSIQDFLDLECRNDKAPTPQGASFDDVLMYVQAAI
jgi:hypothetical protein